LARVTPDQYYEKLARRLKQATTDIENGVKLVTESPTLAASKKADKWINSLMEARTNGRWERSLARVTLEQWKTAMLTKGIPRIASGIDNARTKTVDFAKQLLPYIDNILVQLDKMPDATLEDSINRMVFWTRQMANFTKD